MLYSSLTYVLLFASSSASWLDIEEFRYKEARIRPEKVHFVEGITAVITRNKFRYQEVSRKTGVPWKVIAVIHNMECSLNFRQHLHNGDSLTARTRHVPKGLPKIWNPPSDWETSAADALRYDKLPQENWRTNANWLLNIELYNGSGYLKFHPSIPTPYLWSWTTVYSKGKYVEDGRFDPYAVSKQCGVVPLLLLLKD